MDLTSLHHLIDMHIITHASIHLVYNLKILRKKNYNKNNVLTVFK